MMSSTEKSNPITDNSYKHHSSLKQTNKSKMQRRSNNIMKEIKSRRSKTQEQVYKSKLLQALRHVRLGPGGSSGRAVHEVANRVLAITAQGRTRWSRAILANKLNYKLSMKQRRVLSATTNRSIRLKKLTTVQRKARDLRRLIPGCRKQSLLVVLEEVADYVSALTMQVKVMADVLSDRSSSMPVTIAL